ncbi:hypothetical protein BBJ28_00003801 [Nothophytophthora sp. Chile5]|nr:hypothetical protein BBJ28_00003801 [Nothophytophthora sp. Chile5]
MSFLASSGILPNPKAFLLIFRMRLQLKRAFVALQERYVSALAVGCCPTMDLIAVLTLDRHLIKLLHVKPSDVGFEMVALEWRPDGLQLAVGCDEGDVAVFEIESGELLPERRALRDSFRHEHSVTAMHWVQVNSSEAKMVSSSRSDKRRRRKTATEWATSQSKAQFGRRANRFLAGLGDDVASNQDTVLATADTHGHIALWWMGKVLLTRIDVRTYFSVEEERFLKPNGRQEGVTSPGFRIDRVHMAPDLSLLFVLLVFSTSDGNSDDGHIPSKSTENAHGRRYRVLTLDLSAIQRLHEDVACTAETVDYVHTLLNDMLLAGRQLSTEWKSATRIFELKMGLMGSLYEKYACEDPPQVDMLSVVASGITSPALAQYFAQDIQELVSILL